jgi:hypothetical protein
MGDAFQQAGFCWMLTPHLGQLSHPNRPVPQAQTRVRV